MDIIRSSCFECRNKKICKHKETLSEFIEDFTSDKSYDDWLAIKLTCRYFSVDVYPEEDEKFMENK